MTKTQLRALFDYKDGLFVRKTNMGAVAPKGQVVKGTLHHAGYLYLRVKGRMSLYHRMIFLWHHGYLPKVVDHVDGNSLNNLVENLRPASSAQNSWNSKLNKRNTHGLKGLFWCKKDNLWYAAIQVNGTRKKFGWSKDKNKTQRLLIEKRKELHGQFARG